MIHANNNHYIAEEGQTIIRKSDSFDMGDEIWIGVNDSIDNYESVKIENYGD